MIIYNNKMEYYSESVIYNDILYVSGVIPVDNGEIKSNIFSEQVLQVIKNIDTILKKNNLTNENVIKTTCMLTSIDNLEIFNNIYGSYFTNKPSRSCFIVKDLPKKSLCEIEFIAKLD